MLSTSDKKPLLKELRQILQRAQMLHQRNPRHHGPLTAFYQALGAAFDDGSIARPLAKKSS